MPSLSTVTPNGVLRPVNGSAVGALDPAGNFSTWLLSCSVTNTSPALSTAIPHGTATPVNGSAVWAVAPGGPRRQRLRHRHRHRPGADAGGRPRTTGSAPKAGGWCAPRQVV